MSKCGRMLAGVAIVAVALTGCITSVVVPDVHGKTLVEATALFTGAGLLVGTVSEDYSATVAKGTVMSQLPAAGSRAMKGTAVSLVFSLGPEPTLTWHYKASDDSVKGLTIAPTTDGGFIVSGGYGGYNMYALKLSSVGSKDWDRVYSKMSTEGTPSELWRAPAAGMREAPGGGYMLLGRGTVEGPDLPEQNYVLVKTNDHGIEQSATALCPRNPYAAGDPHPYCSSTIPVALDLDSEGNVMMVGSSYVGAFFVASIVTTDSAGMVGEDNLNMVIQDNAKAYEEEIQDGHMTQDGGYVLAGYSENGYPHGYAALLIKLDSTGAIEFSKVYQDTADGWGAEAYAVTQTEDGGYLIGGGLYNWITKALYHGWWIGKADENGNLLWMKTFKNDDTITSMTCLMELPGPDHEIVVGGGEHSGDMGLAKLTSAGNLIWDLPLDGFAGHVNAVTLAGPGSIAFVGSGDATVVGKIDYMYEE